jgi:hypothetical protein
MQAANQDHANPLAELISDEVYEILESHNLLSEKGIRDYQIRQKFREDYPYLQFDTIRKIVYKLNTKR